MESKENKERQVGGLAIEDQLPVEVGTTAQLLFVSLLGTDMGTLVSGRLVRFRFLGAAHPF